MVSSQDLKPLPKSKCKCFLWKYKLISRYRVIPHFDVNEIPELAGNILSISFFCLRADNKFTLNLFLPDGKLSLQLMTRVFSNSQHLKMNCRWDKKVFYNKISQRKSHAQRKMEKECTNYIQKNSHFSYTNLMRYSRATCQHLQLQVYTTVLKSLAD